MVGLVDRRRYVTSSHARPGDHLIMTKSAGIEGTAVLASDYTQEISKKIGERAVARASKLSRSISVVDDALTAVKAGGVHAMHDPTEGGLLQGIWELAEASKVGFSIYESVIPVLAETRQICTLFKLNPLRLMGSGCLLIAADRQKSSLIVRHLRRKKIPAQIIGRFTSRRMGRKLVRDDGTSVEINAQERDELYKVIERRRTS
jgi:hydrogenase maturation factor